MILDNLIDSYKGNMINDLQELIKIPSVNTDAVLNKPFGENIDRALKYIINKSEQFGLNVENFDNYIAHAEFGTGNETIGVLVHLDVVDAGDGWDYPPFGAEIHNGQIYGRGTSDDKGAVIASLYALKAIKESSIKLNKKIRIIFGTNEEVAWKGITYYLTKNKEPDKTIVIDGVFPLIYAEKGVLSLELTKKIDSKYKIHKLKGGTSINSVPDYCEIVLEKNKYEIYKEKIEKAIKNYNGKITLINRDNKILIISKGISSHSSSPENGLNAISQLFCFLADILNTQKEFGSFCKIIKEHIGMDFYGKPLNIDYCHHEFGKLTLNIGTVKIDDEKIKLGIDIRYPVSLNKDKILKELNLFSNKNDLEMVLIEELKPIYHSLDSQFVKQLLKVYRDVTGDYDSQPLSIGGASYARALNNAIAFGGCMPSDEIRIHEKNEKIPIDSLIKMSKVIARAMFELAL